MSLRFFPAQSRLVSLIGIGFAVGALAACSPPAERPAGAETADAAAADTAASTPAIVQPGARVAAPSAPAFAVIYPGAEPDGPPTLATSPAGPGGIVIFTTDASPEEVVSFYRAHTESAGLAPIINMTRDGAKAFSAGDGAQGRGQLLSVVATPLPDGGSSVQLDWSAGR